MTKLTLHIFSGNYNGSLSAKFFTNNKMLQVVPEFKDGHNIFDFDIELPTNFNIFIDGKDRLLDTQVDDDSKIIQDKFIRIEEIIIDGKPIDKNAVHKIIKMTTNEGETIISNYIGFNGMVSIDFNYQDSFVAHLSVQSMLGQQVDKKIDLIS